MKDFCAVMGVASGVLLAGGLNELYGMQEVCVHSSAQCDAHCTRVSIYAPDIPSTASIIAMIVRTTR